MITVNDLLALFIEENSQEVKLFDVEKETEFYSGRAGDMPSEYGFFEIQSIDNIGKYYGKDLVLNVSRNN